VWLAHKQNSTQLQTGIRGNSGQIEHVGVVWAPQILVSDFEQAIIAAARQTFTNIRVMGCYFHFCLCVWRHVQTLGLAGEYNQNPGLKKTIQILMALGYLPLSFVGLQFANLRQRRRAMVTPYPALDQLFDYISNTWVRPNALNPPTLWNVHNRPMSRRTNNAVESFNNRWNAKVGNRRPKLWVFLRILKDEQSAHERTVENMHNGIPAPRRRAKWRRLEKRVVTLKSKLQRGNRTLENYLKAITHSTHNVV
jgi:hypothetical protein